MKYELVIFWTDDSQLTFTCKKWVPQDGFLILVLGDGKFKVFSAQLIHHFTVEPILDDPIADEMDNPNDQGRY